MNCVYKLYNYDRLIYIGQSINSYARLKNHLALQSWKQEITHIAIAECPTKIDMDLYEKYYINKLNPIYNKILVYNEIPTIKLDELNFKKYSVVDFLELKDTKITKPKKISKRDLMIDELLKRSKEIKYDEKIDFLNTSYNSFYIYNKSNTILETIEIKECRPLFKTILIRIKNKEFRFENDNYYFDFYNEPDIYENHCDFVIDIEICKYEINKGKRIQKYSGSVMFLNSATKCERTGDVTLYIYKPLFEEHFNKYFKY